MAQRLDELARRKSEEEEEAIEDENSDDDLLEEHGRFHGVSQNKQMLTAPTSRNAFNARYFVLLNCFTGEGKEACIIYLKSNSYRTLFLILTRQILHSKYFLQPVFCIPRNRLDLLT